MNYYGFFFDNLKAMKESLAKTTTTIASERENISNIEKEISALNEEIYS